MEDQRPETRDQRPETETGDKDKPGLSLSDAIPCHEEVRDGM